MSNIEQGMSNFEIRLYVLIRYSMVDAQYSKAIDRKCHLACSPLLIVRISGYVVFIVCFDVFFG